MRIKKEWNAVQTEILEQYKNGIETAYSEEP